MEFLSALPPILKVENLCVGPYLLRSLDPHVRGSVRILVNGLNSSFPNSSYSYAPAALIKLGWYPYRSKGFPSTYLTHCLSNFPFCKWPKNCFCSKVSIGIGSPCNTKPRFCHSLLSGGEKIAWKFLKNSSWILAVSSSHMPSLDRILFYYIPQTTQLSNNNNRGYPIIGHCPIKIDRKSYILIYLNWFL